VGHLSALHGVEQEAAMGVLDQHGHVDEQRFRGACGFAGAHDREAQAGGWVRGR
jgi:hypothetical protein